MKKTEGHSAIGIYGTNGAGKTTIAKLMFERFAFSEVQTTDNLFKVFRFSNPDHPYRRVCSYTAWEALGWKSEESIIEGFKNYRAAVGPYVSTLIERVKNEHFTLIFEGIHFDPSLGLNREVSVIPILLTLQNEEVHRQRIIKKAADRKELEEKLLANLATIRSIQNYLIKEAEGFGVTMADTGRDRPARTLKKLLAGINDYQRSHPHPN